MRERDSDIRVSVSNSDSSCRKLFCSFFNTLLCNLTTVLQPHRFIQRTSNCPCFSSCLPPSLPGKLVCILQSPTQRSPPLKLSCGDSPESELPSAPIKYHSVASFRLYHGSCCVCFLARLWFLESPPLSFDTFVPVPGPASAQ